MSPAFPPVHRLVPLLLTASLFAATLLSAAEPSSPPGTDRLAPFFQTGKLRILVLSGRNNHDWRATTPFLRRILIDSDRFDVRVNEMVDGITADTLAPFHALVMDYGGPRWPAATEHAVEAFVANGHGLVLVHGAVYHFSGLDVLGDGHRVVARGEAPWPAFRQMAGCGWDSPPASGNGIASVVFGALALVLALLMMSNEWGRLFVPTAALVGLSLLFAASSIARVKKGTERGRYGQAAVSLVLIAVAVWFFRIDVTPWIDLIVTKVTEPTPVWPSSSGS